MSSKIGGRALRTTPQSRKTEMLDHPKRSTPPPRFIDGTSVKTNDHVKYLRSLISWHKPTLTALQHRISLANTAFNKLTNLWHSNLSHKAKVHIYLANIVPVFLHAVAMRTMENKHYAKIDFWFFSHLRRVITWYKSVLLLTHPKQGGLVTGGKNP